MAIKASQSRIKDWRKCRRLHFYRWVLKIAPKRIKRPFMFGGIVHKMLDAQANGEDPFAVLNTISFDNQKLFAAERELYGEIVDDLGVIMREYFAFYPERDLRLEAISGQYSEHEFKIDLGEDILFTGAIDAIGRTPAGRRWLIDTKTFGKRLPDPQDRWINVQSTVYTRAMEILGFGKVDGTCWNYIKSKPPTKPQLLKSGRAFSTNKKIITLPQMVRNACKEHGFSVRSHDKLMAQAEASRGEYFQRYFTPLNKTVRASIFSGFVDSARDIRDNQLRDSSMSLGRECKWCDYASICKAELTGADKDFIIEREYAPRKSHYKGEKVHTAPAYLEGSGRATISGPSVIRILWPKRLGQNDSHLDVSKTHPTD